LRFVIEMSIRNISCSEIGRVKESQVLCAVFYKMDLTICIFFLYFVIISMLSTSQVRPSVSSANTERCFQTTQNQRSFKTCRALNLWLPWRESLKRPRSSQSRRRRSLASAPSPSRRPSVGVCKPKPGANFMKPFSSSQIVGQNTVVCLSLANFSGS